MVKKKTKRPSRNKSKTVPLVLPARPHQPKELGVLALIVKSFVLSFLIATTILLVTGLSLTAYFYTKSLAFSGPAQTTLTELTKIFLSGWKTTPQQDNGKVNFLILGSDELSNRDSSKPLTDTMIIASLDLKTAQIGLYSLPRDIWLPEYKAKINALYSYSREQNPADPLNLTKLEASQLTGIPIQHVVLIKLDTLSQMVDLVGGVDVYVKESFTDPLFPRSDVDVTKVHDPKILYETVSFASGSAHLNGSDVLKYVRSRHSTGAEGSDNARGSRQQDVILALISKFKDQTFWYDLGRDGELYHFYISNFNQYLPITEAIGIGRLLKPNINNLTFKESTPPIFPDVTNGVIYHPTGDSSKYFGAWVYEIKDQKLFENDARFALGYATSSATISK